MAAGRWIVVLLASALVCSSWGLRLRRTGLLSAPPLPKGVSPPEAQWCEQKLDHFNQEDKRMWKQRYFVNDTHWDRKSGPVFLMIGGEGPANPIWLTTGDMMKNSAKYNALAVFLEHRFYGASHPTTNLSLANMVYLSSRQALLDIVSFKEHLFQQYNLTKENRWISFGGSYPGALSAWLRLKYPDTVIGAIATSAPVQAKMDFFEYLEVVFRSLATSAQGLLCDAYIKMATTELEKMLSNTSQWRDVEKLFHIDPPLKTPMDLQMLAQDLAGNFMGVVQYNRDNTAFEGRPNNITLDDLCAIMGNISLGAPLLRYAAVNDLLLKQAGAKTIDADFQQEVNFMKETSWGSPASYGDRQWVYQTCAEFGYFQTTDSEKQPFGTLVTLDAYTQICSQVYNISAGSINQSVASTNAYYSGRDIPANVTNIVFPNGSIDPWHALGITHNLTDSLTAIYIDGTAHCANMYPARDTDLPALVTAREEITHILGAWLKTREL